VAGRRVAMCGGIAACIAVFPLGAAAAEGPAPATAAPVRQDWPPAAVLALTADCSSTGDLTKLSGLVAGALRNSGALRPFPEGAAPTTAADAVPRARALIDAARKNYFDTHYQEAAKQFELAGAGLAQASIPAAEDAKRWSAIDSARGYLALAHRAAGDEARYRAAVRAIAATRPSATFDVSFPPDFRKDFEGAVDAALAGPVAPVTVSAPVGAWRVRINGVERGATPLTVKLPLGTHAIGVLRGDGSVGYRLIEVGEKGTALEIDPLEGSGRTADGTAVVCIPPGAEIAKDDARKIIGRAAAPAPEVVSVYPAPGGFMAVRAALDPGGVKAAMLLPAADAADAAKVAAVVDSLYAAPGPPVQTDLGAAETAAQDEGILGKWWFWTAVGVVTVAAVGVPLYFWLGGAGDNSLGDSGIKP